MGQQNTAMHKVLNLSTSLRNQLIIHTLICLIPLALAVLLAVLHLPLLAGVLAILGVVGASFAFYRLHLYISNAFEEMTKALLTPVEAQTKSLPSEFKTVAQAIKQFYSPQLAQLRTEITALAAYKATLNQLDSAIMLLDSQGQVTDCNTCCRDFIAAHSITLATLELDKPNTSGQAPSLPAILEQPDLLIGNETQAVDKIIKKDNTTFNLHLVPLLDYGWLVVWTDISARFATEEQLQKSIGKAITGDFKGRISLEQQQGFMQGLGKGFNMLMDSIQEPLQETVKIQQLLANGDLTHKLDGFYLGEFATVKSAINQSIDKLLEVVKKVNQVSSSIHQNLSEINQHNAEINNRFSHQNDSLTQAAASLEQMTASVKQNSDHTNRTNALATKAHQQADFGNSISIKLMSAMKDINDASLKVVDISNVIDEIAFQTKLLALNAAVEAARAGEHGRGFKVVASEVQSLAQRSAEAAKEIKSLVIDNMAKIKTGSEFVHQTDHALTSILQDSETVNQLVGEISTAIEEEYIGINQINQVVLNIQTIAEDNTHAVNFVMSLSEEAKQQAESLSQLMAFFNTGEQQRLDCADETIVLTSVAFDTPIAPVVSHSITASVSPDEEPPEDDFFI